MGNAPSISCTVDSEFSNREQRLGSGGSAGFCAVARHSSFAAAAADLGISPAYVTKRIADFEKALGVTLFRRTTRQVHITDEGALISVGARVLDAAKGLTEEVSDRKGSPTGLLRISTSMRLGHQHVSHVLASCRSNTPGSRCGWSCLIAAWT